MWLYIEWKHARYWNCSHTKEIRKGINYLVHSYILFYKKFERFTDRIPFIHHIICILDLKMISCTTVQRFIPNKYWANHTSNIVTCNFRWYKISIFIANLTTHNRTRQLSHMKKLVNLIKRISKKSRAHNRKWKTAMRYIKIASE